MQMSFVHVLSSNPMNFTTSTNDWYVTLQVSVVRWSKMCATATFSARMVAAVLTGSVYVHQDTRAWTVKKVSMNKQHLQVYHI